MDEKELKASSEWFNLVLEKAVEHANQVDVDEPPIVLPEREKVH
jgi:hypothetical protein